MTLTHCQNKKDGEREGKVVSQHTSLFPGSRRKCPKSAVVEGFRVVQ